MNKDEIRAELRRKSRRKEMTFDEWMNGHQLSPRTQELQDCWEAAQAAMAEPPQVLTESWIATAIRDVAELGERSSPADWPEAMLVTADELRLILEERAPPRTEPVLTDADAKRIWLSCKSINTDEFCKEYTAAILAAAIPPGHVVVPVELVDAAKQALTMMIRCNTPFSTEYDEALTALGDALAARPGEKK